MTQQSILSHEDSVTLRAISDKLSDLIISNKDSIPSDHVLQQKIDQLIDSARSIDQNDFNVNYNYLIYTGIIGDYEQRPEPCRKLYSITQNPAYLNALIHAFIKLDRQDSVHTWTLKTSRIIERKIEEHPEDMEMQINKLTFLCLTSDDHAVSEYFESLRSGTKKDTTLDSLYKQYLEIGCLAFVPE